MKKKMLFVVATIMAFVLFVPSALAATVFATTEEEFFTAVEEGNAVTLRKDINIKLEKDISITTKVTIESNTTTLDLNGHKITLSESRAQLYVPKNGKLIVKDSTGGGLITTGQSTSIASYPVHIQGACEINGGILEITTTEKYIVHNQGTLIMNGGTIRNTFDSEKSYSGSGKVVHNQGTFTMNNGTIINTWGKGGDTVYNNLGTFIMNGGKIVNKAVSTSRYAAAINGHSILMKGGELESEGTGIVASGSNVEITGGTINAKGYGLLTRYATIRPAEGKQVNITAGIAAVKAYSAPASGIGNQIYGGNFDAPMLVKAYGAETDANNVEVHGGRFTFDVSNYVVDGKYAEKVGEVYEIKEYTQMPDITPIDPKEEVEDTTVGVTDNEETGNILMDSLDAVVAGDEDLENAVNNSNVVVVVDVSSKDTDELDEEVLEKIEKAAEDLVIADYFDIKVLINDDQDNTLGTISELTEEIELIILLPGELINTDKNVTRKYYVIREHDNDSEAEIIEDVKLSEDGKSLIFKSNKFSTYALAYEDVKKELPPKTGDINLIVLIGTILVGMVGMAIILRKRFAKSN